MYKQVVKDRFYKYLFPMCMTALAFSISEFMDSIVVSNLLDSNALAVLNMGGAFDLIVSAFFSLLGIGGSICYAKYQGMADSKAAQKIYSLSITSAIIVGLFITIVSCIFSDTVVNTLCKTDELKPMFESYIMIRIMGAPLMCVVMTGISFLPAAGYPVESTVFNAGYNICNILLDIVFIRLFNMGVAGAAIASIISVLIWAIGTYIWLWKKKCQLSYSIKGCIVFKNFREITALGFAIAVSQVGLSIRIAYCNGILNDIFGKEGIITFSVCMQIISIMSIFLSGVLRTEIPLVSMLDGQNDNEGIRDSIRRGMLILGIVSIALAGLFMCFPELLLQIYNASEIKFFELAETEIRIFASALGVRCLIMLYMAYLGAIGRKKYSLFISLFDSFIGIFLLAKPMIAVFGPMGFWWSYPLVSLVLCLCIAIINSVISKKSNGQIEPLFLTTKEKNRTLHFTYIKDDAECLSRASVEASEFAKKQGCSVRACNAVGLVMEEYPIYILQHVKYISLVDSIVGCVDNDIVINFRIVGKAYENNWLKNDNNPENNRIIEGLISKIEYSYVMGINNSKIIIRGNGDTYEK